ncbi:unnamed protein product [Bemisia tabaci]|uniref:Polyprotein n=2 Tax=Eukaryota TaxID=2759 RepID=A0A9P0AKA0_BEMTA|nr:unnamed protein product [Bemisia tabaci]
MESESQPKVLVQSFLKLDETNWNLWKFQTRVVLTAKDLFEITTGESKMPVVPEEVLTGTAEDIAASREAVTQALKDAKMFKLKDARAQEILVTRMEKGPLSHILSCNSASEMWAKLVNIYERQSNVSVHLLQQQFFNAKFDGSVMEFVTKIQNLSTELKQRKEAIPDKMVITKVLMSLPDRFKHFVSAWESVPVAEQTIDNLTSRLLVEEERQKSGEEAVALVAQSFSNLTCFRCGNRGHKKDQCHTRQSYNNRGRGRFNQARGGRNDNHTGKSGNPMNDSRSNGDAGDQKPQRGGIQCNFCHRYGHLWKHCRFRKSKENGAKTENSGNDNDNGGSSLAFLCAAEWESDSNFYLDSGATEHMCKNREYFSSYTPLTEERRIKIGDGSEILAIGIGTVSVQSFNGTRYVDMDINNVLHIPHLKVNLLSQGKSLDKGFSLISNAHEARFIEEKTQKVCAIATRQDTLFKMNFRINYSKVEISCLSATTSSQRTLVWWHKKLSHQNFEHVKKILRLNGISWKDSQETNFCEACIEGKHHRQPFYSSKTQTHAICELIHADLCGPMETHSIAGSRYMLVLKDDYSHFRYVYFLKHKDEVFDHFIKFFKLCQTQFNKTVKVVRADNGGEFDNNRMQKFLEENGVVYQSTVAYMPEQNGKVEREMRTIVEAARTMMADKKLGKKFWAEAANTAVFVINRTGTSSLPGKTPYEVWYDKPFDVNKLIAPFGSEVWTHVPKQKRRKLDVKSQKGLFLGYGETTKGYRIYYESRNEVSLVRDFILVPDNYVLTDSACESPIYINIDEDESTEIRASTNSEVRAAAINVDDPPQNVIDENGEPPNIAENVNIEENINNAPNLQRPSRVLKLPKKLEDYELNLIAALTAGCLPSEVPHSYQEAISSDEDWTTAIKTELAAHDKNGTLEYHRHRSAEKNPELFTGLIHCKASEESYILSSAEYSSKCQSLRGPNRVYQEFLGPGLHGPFLYRGT